jgi:hypothetical protein
MTLLLPRPLAGPTLPASAVAPGSPVAPRQDDTTTATASTTSTEASTTTTEPSTSSSEETTTTEESTTTTASTTTSSSSTTTSSTTTTTLARTNGDSAGSGASLALAGVLLLALAVGGGVLLWRARNNALARKALTSRVSHVVSRAQGILAWLTVKDGDPNATPPVGVPPIDDIHAELTGLSAQIAGARRAAQADDRSALAVLDDLDRATRDLLAHAESPQISTFRVAVARTRGWLYAG